MKIPQSIRDKYKQSDPELDVFIDNFDMPAGSKILEVGAHDNPVSILLAESGFKVHGIDLRDYDCGTHQNYTHHTMNFLKLTPEFLREFAGSFDAVICVSAIEHFGLGTYSDKAYNPYADVAATINIYNLLKYHGYLFLTTPFGGRYMEVRPHWKVYDFAELFYRFGINMHMDAFSIKCAEKINLLGRTFEIGESIDMQSALSNLNGAPAICAFARFWKPPLNQTGE